MTYRCITFTSIISIAFVLSLSFFCVWIAISSLVLASSISYSGSMSIRVSLLPLIVGMPLFIYPSRYRWRLLQRLMPALLGRMWKECVCDSQSRRHGWAKRRASYLSDSVRESASVWHGHPVHLVSHCQHGARDFTACAGLSESIRVTASFRVYW